MAAVQVTDIRVLNNPSKFTDKFAFEITFESQHELVEDLEWRLTYVGSADSSNYDQQLDSILVGPVPLGQNRFVFEAPAPDPSKIPVQDLLGVTIVLLECLYKDKIFVRVGYYVSNEDPDQIVQAVDAPVAASTLGDNAQDEQMEEDLKSDEEEDSVEEDDEEEEDEDEMLVEEPPADDAATLNSMGQVEFAPREPKPTTAEVSGTENVNGNVIQPIKAKRQVIEIPPPSKIRRCILSDKPRVTRFPIAWDEPAPVVNADEL